MILKYKYYELHNTEPHTITTYENYEAMKDTDKTYHFYTGDSTSPTCSLYVPVSEIKIENITDTVDRLIYNEKFQLFAKKC